MRKFLLRKIICTAACILITSFLFAQDELNGVIKGKVFGKEEVLPVATVSIGNKTILTNHAGEYSISIKPGIYTITISYTGFQPANQEIIVKACEIVELNFTLAVSKQLKDISILGSRSSIQRSNMNTPVPVDIISAKNLPSGLKDLTQQLSVTAPSFNSPPQTIGTGAIASPATLRGLGPDEALVLINGHRRHTTANIYLQSLLGYGTVATDLNTIPGAAVENIEILRDGASAQYGSDAIAGVINFQLKKTTGITSVNLSLGQSYKGDGGSVSFDINRGYPILKNGFINFTSAFHFSNPTQRNGMYDSTVYYPIPVGATQTQIANIRQLDNQKVSERGFDRLNFRPIGSPEILNSSLIVNGGYPLNQNINLFWTGMINYRFSEDKSSLVYRYPKDTTTVITALYPDGFEPYVISLLTDLSLIAGIEGATNNGWHWDFSNTYGSNSTNPTVLNTNNATQYAMGKNAGTRFYPGSILFSQNTTNLNFSRDFSKYFNHIRSFTSSLGGEFRIDHYNITEGAAESWQNFDSTSKRIGGSQGLPGYGPDNAVTKNRYISAAYLELEMDKDKQFLWNLAGRYEYYSDFGANLAGKLAMRYKFSDRLLIRGSVSNGFRAPALQQRYFSAINQVGGRNVPGIVVTGTFRNDSKIAEAFGIAPLKAEKSINLSGGITSKITKNIDLTIDAYWIQIRNRIILTGNIPDSRPAVRNILDSLNRKDIQSVRFFTNAVSTHTMGIDLVATGTWPIYKSVLDISLSANFNKTNIFGAVQSAKNLPDDSTYQYLLINPEERGRIEQSQPLDKIILTVSYKSGKWEFRARSIHFGKAAHIYMDADRSRDEFFSPKITSGMNIGYSPKKWLTIRGGASNIFNVYPDKITNRKNTQGGLLIYDANGTQIGYNGGFYFMKVEMNL